MSSLENLTTEERAAVEAEAEAYVATKYFPPIYTAPEEVLPPFARAAGHQLRDVVVDQSKYPRNIFLVENVLTPEECKWLVDRGESWGYEPSTVYSVEQDDNIVMKDVRDNFRVLEKFPALAKRLWELIEPFFPEEIDGKKKLGLFEMFRYYRYGPTQNFAPHVDHTVFTEDLDGTESRYTVLTYLNDLETGGQTRFPEVVYDSSITSAAVTPASATEGTFISPRAGSILAFRHDNLHEGCKVNAGMKYVVRTDAMYK